VAVMIVCCSVWYWAVIINKVILLRNKLEFRLSEKKSDRPMRRQLLNGQC